MADAALVAPSLGLSIKVYRATSWPEPETALTSIASDRMNGLANFQGAFSRTVR